MVQVTLENEFGKNPDIKSDDVKALREWLKTQHHLPEKHITDVELILAYHSCERSLEVSKQVLDLHYTLRTHMPFLQDLRFRLEDKLRLKGLLTQLPNLTKDGYKVVYSRFVNFDTKNFSVVDIARAFIMLTDLWLHEEGTWPGFVFLIDLAGVSISHIAKIDIGTLQHFLYFLQEALLVKLKAVHFLNAPSFIDTLMRMMKPFLKSTLLDLVHVQQEIHVEGVDSRDLPKDAGGEWKDLDTLTDEMFSKLLNNEEFFSSQRKKLVDESRRVGTKKALSDIFGIQGSFRKLDID